MYKKVEKYHLLRRNPNGKKLRKTPLHVMTSSQLPNKKPQDSQHSQIFSSSLILSYTLSEKSRVWSEKKHRWVKGLPHRDDNTVQGNSCAGS